MGKSTMNGHVQYVAMLVYQRVHPWPTSYQLGSTTAPQAGNRHLGQEGVRGGGCNHQALSKQCSPRATACCRHCTPWSWPMWMDNLPRCSTSSWAVGGFWRFWVPQEAWIRRKAASSVSSANWCLQSFVLREPVTIKFCYPSGLYFTGAEPSAYRWPTHSGSVILTRRWRSKPESSWRPAFLPMLQWELLPLIMTQPRGVVR